MGKQTLLASGFFGDNLVTHFTSSLGAGAIATTMTQPLDVLKTRSMNAKPGEFASSVDVFKTTLREGPMAFYKGYIPAFVRLGPQTILTFIFFEQRRNYKHAIDGLIRVGKEEGVKKLFNGVDWATGR